MANLDDFLSAAQDGDLEMVKFFLVNNYVEVNQSDDQGLTALILSSCNGHLDIVQYLLGHGANVNQATKRGTIPLMQAVFFGHYEIVMCLIVNNADPNQGLIDDGTTLLYISSQEGHLDIVRLLVYNNANVNKGRNNGTSPLYVSSQKGLLEIVRFLVENNANVNECTEAGGTPLFISCQEGHLDVVRFLVENNAKVDTGLIEDGATPLYISCQEGHLAIVRFLVDNKANLNHACGNGVTPLCISSEKGHLDIVQYLLGHGANVNQATKRGTTPLMQAVFFGHYEIVMCLIVNNADPNQGLIDDGTTPLYISSQEGNLDIVKFLVYNNANVNKGRNNGTSPLYVSSQKGLLEIVRFLVENNANVNEGRTDTGGTPLFISCQEGHLDVVQFLVENNANVDTGLTEDSATPLFISSQEGHLDIVRFLVENNANVNKGGKTPLYISSQEGHLAIVKFLVENKANINHGYRDDGVTPLYISSENGQPDIVKLLLQKNAVVNQETIDGTTPLFISSQNGHLDIVRLLVKHNADVNAVNNEGVAPLMVAALKGRLPVVRYLAENGANVNHVSQRGITALHCAALSTLSKDRPIQLIKYLLEISKLSINFELLRVCITKGNVDLLKTVISFHFKVEIDHLIFFHTDPDIGLEAASFLRDVLSSQIINTETCKKMVQKYSDTLPFEVDFLITEANEIISYLTYLKDEADDLYCLISSESFKMRNYKPFYSLELTDFVISGHSSVNILAVRLTDDLLGKGCFGSVRVGVNSETEQIYAVKCIDLINSRSVKKLKMSFLVTEIENIQKLRHDNIVDFFGHKLSHEKGKPFLYLITELCREDLHKHFVEDGSKFDRNPSNALDYDSSLQYFLNIALQLFDGLSFVHMKRFIHKDIKLQNIFISYEYRVKIGDFGLCDKVEKDVEIASSKKGTPVYLPPEVHQSMMYSSATDIFASGMVLFELWHGEVYYQIDPFKDKSGKEIIKDLKNGIRPEFVDNRRADEIKELIKECWHGDYNQRPTAQAACDKFWDIFTKLVGDRKPNLGQIIQFKPGCAKEKEIKPGKPLSDYDIGLSCLSQMMSQAKGSGNAPLPMSALIRSLPSSSSASPGSG